MPPPPIQDVTLNLLVQIDRLLDAADKVKTLRDSLVESVRSGPSPSTRMTPPAVEVSRAD